MGVLLSGFSWLFTGISGLVVSLVTFLAGLIGRRVVLFTAITTALAAALATFTALLISQASSLVAQSFPQAAQVAGYFFPSNMAACISVIITCHIGKWVYQMTKEMIFTRAQQ